MRHFRALGFVAFPAIVAIDASQAKADLFDNFSFGSPAFGTDYTLVGTGFLTAPPDYAIVNNPATSLANGFSSFYDHSVGTAAGSMLFFDGSGNASQRIWYENIDLLSGVTYGFSYWGASCSAESVPVLQFNLSGMTLSGTLTTANANWTEYSTTITVRTAATYTLSIRDTNTIANGNDGAIDDVSVSIVPEPTTTAATITLAGLCLLERSKRRRSLAT